MNPEAQQFLAVAKNRYTSRSYLDRSVGDGVAQVILEAGRWAPSAANTQPWELILIEDSALKKELKTAFMEDAKGRDSHYQRVSRRQANLLEAPLLICVCGNPSSQDDYIDASTMSEPDRESLFLLGMGALIQNMLLAATSLGLGSTWLARPARVAKIAQLLGIPVGIRVVAILAFGHGREHPAPAEGRRISIEKKTYQNKFGVKPSANIFLQGRLN